MQYRTVERDDIIKGEITQAVTIFDIDYPIADVIRSLNQKSEWMTRPDSMHRITSDQAALFGDNLEQLTILGNKPLLFGADTGEDAATKRGFAGIFGKSGQGGAGELQATVVIGVL